MQADKPKKTYAIALLFVLTVGLSLLALRALDSTTPPMSTEPAVRAGDTGARATHGAKGETVEKRQADEPTISTHKIPL